MTDHAVFAGGIHRLKDHENRLLTGGIEHFLMAVEFCPLRRQEFLVMLLGSIKRRSKGLDLIKAQPGPRQHLVGIRMDFRHRDRPSA